MRKVVVTGLGIVSPLGNTLEENWTNVINGKSGLGKVTLFDTEKDAYVTTGAEVKNFEPTDYMNEKESKRNQRFVHFAVAASKMALQNAKLDINPDNAPNIGVSIGVGVGGFAFMQEQVTTLMTRGLRRVSPFSIPGFIANMAAGVVSMEVGAKGPNTCVTTACTSGTHSIAESMMMIQTGRADAMICGGAEACICEFSYGAFAQMKALCAKFKDEPQKASRPFDKDRSGFVMGEGSGILILEEYEHAKARGANILCELAGFGASGDAYHFTSPAPGGEGGARSMAQALKTAGISPTEIDYINAHGTSTELNDAMETQAIKTVFGEHAYKLNVSSTKSMTGHLLGAAGGIEAVYTVMALINNEIPPTINLDNPGEGCDLNYTAHTAVKRPVNAALSNSFGFGGTNCTLAFRKI